MTTYIRGGTVENATSYELHEKEQGMNNIYTSDGEKSGYVLNSSGTETAKAINKINETYFPCAVGQYLSFKGNNVADTLYDGVQNACFYTADKTYIKRVNFENLGVQNLKIDATDCAYVRFSLGINATDVIIILSDEATTYTDDTFPTEVTPDTYAYLAENSEINFEVSALGLETGDHTLVVKAVAEGYEDSDWSNEIVYTA